ncbi:helix-turn-helix domain-containing protein [Natronoflexus pectinivorans]|uniref:Helix-turn-helix protein n=1 Tax=Natronoflexus pectinivorans TaxID=682526 RepID=A0A4R2GMC1_9BACT|nr:XRE family transcriptional regulator [Natronoflexus pectinivorans]TCO09920.1 helix-turn-helix protein [Natronoflexus pectinivorans]
MKRLGSRIKKKRELLGMPLGEVARLAGISSSALSQIENAKAFPSIITLKSVANAIGSTVGELIGENEMAAPAPIVPDQDKVLVDKNETGAALYMLTHREEGRIMGAYQVVLEKGASSGDWMKKHSGQEFSYIVAGEVTFFVDDQTYAMKKGDSLYTNSQKRREVVNSGSSMAEVLWVITPPYF